MGMYWYKDQGHSRRTKDGGTFGQTLQILRWQPTETNCVTPGLLLLICQRPSQFRNPSLAPTPPLFPSPPPHHNLKSGSIFTSWLSSSLRAHPPSQCGIFLLNWLTSHPLLPPRSYPSGLNKSLLHCCRFIFIRSQEVVFLSQGTDWSNVHSASPSFWGGSCICLHMGNSHQHSPWMLNTESTESYIYHAFPNSYMPTVVLSRFMPLAYLHWQSHYFYIWGLAVGQNSSWGDTAHLTPGRQLTTDKSTNTTNVQLGKLGLFPGAEIAQNPTPAWVTVHNAGKLGHTPTHRQLNTLEYPFQVPWLI
jgi:hypothetical protein